MAGRSFGKYDFSYFKSEISALLVAALGLFIAVCLYSYNPTDSSWFYYSSTSNIVNNWAGPVGAYIAAFIMYFFGAAGYGISLLLFFIAYMLLNKTHLADEWERLLALNVLIIVFAALLCAHSVNIMPGNCAGGVIGTTVYKLLELFLDVIGAWLCLYTLLLVSLIIIFRFSYLTLIQKIFHPYYWRGIYVYGLYPVFVMLAAVTKLIYRASAWTLKYIHELLTDPYDKQSIDEYAFQAGRYAAQDINEQEIANEQISDVLVAASYQVAQENQSELATQAASAISTSVENIESVNEIEEQEEPLVPYTLPNLSIFIGVEDEQNDALLVHELEKRALTLQEKLERFGVEGKVISIKRGPVVTLFEYQPHIDTKISKIIALEDDLALALQALSIRIIAPIPGKSLVGFEVANKNRKNVLLAHVIKSDAYQETKALLPVILGEDTIGNPIVGDLAKMPHLLMAGSTGAGKSVALNAMLISLLCKKNPDDVRLILIDPKRLEFAPYHDIAHLIFPIVTDPKNAAPALRWVVKQMEERYNKMAQFGARNIADYRASSAHKKDPMPFIVVIIDELADLMMTAGKEIEDLITRIAQMARAAGIHIIAATQRPSVDVITGLIKVNFPSRISFRVTSKMDSRTILDCGGADKLLGRGDMLFLDSTDSLLKRVHGAYVSDKEIVQVASHIRSQRDVEYFSMEQYEGPEADIHEEDIELCQQVKLFLNEVDELSISLLQRRFRIGYNRSARIIDWLESQGLIAPSHGGKTRKVLK